MHSIKGWRSSTVVQKVLYKAHVLYCTLFPQSSFFSLEIAFLCFIFQKICFIFVSCLSGWNYPLTVLCQDLESIYFWQLFCKFLWGGMFRWTNLASWFTWEGAPCQVGRRLCQIGSVWAASPLVTYVALGIQDPAFGCCIPVSSLQY